MEDIGVRGSYRPADPSPLTCAASWPPMASRSYTPSYRTSGTMKILGKGSESMPQNTTETPPCPTCGKPGTFQNSDGQCNYYLCPNGHHFYKRIGGSH
jgi:hypothetical protein